MDYAPLPILPAHHPRTARPLDLSFASLRSVSPACLEYMRNMGTRASMPIPLLRGERLGGLISCHHARPRRVPFAARSACDLVGQMLVMPVVSKEDPAHAEERARLKGVEDRLLARVAAAEGRLIEGLADGGTPPDLCALTGAARAAVLTPDGCALVGGKPPKPEVRCLADWLQRRGVGDAFVTHALGAAMPGAEAFADAASGVPAVLISRLHPSFVLWCAPRLCGRWVGAATRVSPRRWRTPGRTCDG